MSLSKYVLGERQLLSTLLRRIRNDLPFFRSNLFRVYPILENSASRSSTSELLRCLAGSQNVQAWTRILFSNPRPPPPPDKPGEESNGSNNNKPDDDDDKISSLLVKAFLWMLTAYMFIAIVSLVFPGSNQPEVCLMTEIIVRLVGF